MTDTVYFYETLNLIKVGYSRDLRNRPATLLRPGKYLGAMLGGREIERTFKEEFAAFAAHGEYFHDDPVVRSTIDRVLLKYGIAGEECVRLTDTCSLPSERVALMDAQIKQRCVETVQRQIETLWRERQTSILAAIDTISAETGARKSVVKNLRYAPENVTLTPAEAQAILALDRIADALDRQEDGAIGR